jgi:Glycosyl transferases group 1
MNIGVETACQRGARAFIADYLATSVITLDERIFQTGIHSIIINLIAAVGMKFGGTFSFRYRGPKSGEPRMRFQEENGRFREPAAALTRPRSPRICMPTWRNFTRQPFRCGLYEAQDVLIEMDDVDLISLDMTWGRWFAETSLRRPLYHDPSGKLIFVNPGLRKVQLDKEYDVFLAVCATLSDLPYINAIAGWRDHCKISVCWIDELWLSNLPNYKNWLHALNQFDYVFMGYRDTVSALSQAGNRPYYWLPGGVDALRFSPFPDTAPRVIDVYSIGRRYRGIHCQILKAAARGELFYVYDSFANTSMAKVYDHRQHRELFANIAKRSRYFVVAPAKFDVRDETRGQTEIGYRYYEGAAAGAVMIGEAPESEAYRELFGWPEVVIPIKPDGSDIMAVLGDLGSDPERMAAISRRNTREVLLHHDWVYRWKEIFRVATIEPSPGMAARERRLKEMADFAASVDENDVDAIRRPELQ